MQQRNKVLGSAVMLVVLILGAWFTIQQMRPPVLNGTSFEPGRRPPDVAMESTLGGQVRLSDFRGRYVVLFFGYTHCPDVCPTTMLKLRNMMAQLSPEEAEQVQVIFVSYRLARNTRCPGTTSDTVRNLLRRPITGRYDLVRSHCQRVIDRSRWQSQTLVGTNPHRQ